MTAFIRYVSYESKLTLISDRLLRKPNHRLMQASLPASDLLPHKLNHRTMPQMQQHFQDYS